MEERVEDRLVPLDSQIVRSKRDRDNWESQRRATPAPFALASADVSCDHQARLNSPEGNVNDVQENTRRGTSFDVGP